MSRRSTLLRTALVLATFAVLVVLPGGARAEGSPPARPSCSDRGVRPSLGPAGEGATASAEGLTDRPRDCLPPTIETAIASAKMTAALAYSAQLEGKATKSQVDSYEVWLRALTGEAARQALPQRPTATFEKPAAKPDTAIQRYFWPFEQITWFYCGPATAESILRFLGPSNSRVRNEDGGFDTLTGKPEDDQPTLANERWLATDANEGTNWGNDYMPRTLNAWRGTRWYVGSATPTLEGTLTQAEALAAIKFDTDRSYPVAENVLYSNSTYYPAGFWPGVRYEHWDTVYGHYQEDGHEVVQVGQTYHDQRLPYDRFQDVDWDVHWRAIEAWYGIVW